MTGCVDDDAGEAQSFTVEVDREIFRVRRHAGESASYSYEWLTGAHRGYGFTSSLSMGHDQTPEGHLIAIRNFLAAIDPETGYVGDT